MAYQIQDFAQVDTAANRLAQQIAADLRHALANASPDARALLLVSGGRSPLPLFSALSQQTLAWSRIDVSLVDERSVPTAHVDSNAALVRQHLLINAASQARWLSLMPDDAGGMADDPWTQACRAADVANANPDLAKPAVVVLGIGNDGHTASLFADAPQWLLAQHTQDRYLAVQPAQAPPAQAPHARISLSLTALRAQRNCYVWAVGVDKRATIDRCRTLPASSCALAALIHAPDVMLHVFCSQQ